jgi:hypothetical protein
MKSDLAVAGGRKSGIWYTQEFGVPFRALTKVDGWYRPDGPWIVIVRDLRQYIRTLNKSEWRQFPTQHAWALAERERKAHEREVQQKLKFAKALQKKCEQAACKRAREVSAALRQLRRFNYTGFDISPDTVNSGDCIYDGLRILSADTLTPYIDLRHDADTRILTKGDMRFAVMMADLTPGIVERYYRLWHDASGYRNALGAARQLILPIKEKIVHWQLAEAKKRKWVYGAKDGILYIDTPEGQVSFHSCGAVEPYSPYSGEWSGKKDSQQILEQLLSKESASDLAFGGAQSHAVPLAPSSMGRGLLP